MSLSSTSLGFLRNLHTALEGVETDGIPPTGLSTERTLLIGNGGSAAIAEHIAVDMVKAKCDAQALTNPVILSCLANDLGYENVFRHQLLGASGTVLIAISSSGKSPNIINAAAYAASLGVYVVTMTGFDADNPLRGMGDYNVWVPSHNYGVVECAHLAILHSIVKPS